MRNNITIPTIEEIEELILPLKNQIRELKTELNNTPTQKKYYRNKDLKRVFNFSDNTIKQKRDTNKIPYTEIDGIYFYPVDGINKILEQNSNYDLIDEVA